jgi:hypothetical protein
MRVALRIATSGVVALGLLALARCSFGIDPDQGHFSCVTTADCATGQECVPQADGGNNGNGLCYAVGTCIPETCNGKDDDCDGVIDDHDPCGPDGGVDGGPLACVVKVELPDGGIVDAGTGTLVYRCDVP